VGVQQGPCGPHGHISPAMPWSVQGKVVDCDQMNAWRCLRQARGLARPTWAGEDMVFFAMLESIQEMAVYCDQMSAVLLYGIQSVGGRGRP
jgi:hypothetical protein